MEERVQILEKKYSEIRQSQDDLLVMNVNANKKLESTEKKIDLIYDCLMGNELERATRNNGHGGGVMKRLSKTEDNVDDINLYIERSKGRNRAIWGVIGLLGGVLVGFILDVWHKVFN